MKMSKLPIIVAPMFLVSTPQMVIEAGKAGVIGSFPLLNARPVSKCAEWLHEVKSSVGNTSWAVNLISHKKSNKRYDDDVGLIKEYEPPIVITSLGNPSEVIDIVHSYGGLVYSDVATVKHAKKAAQGGVDGLVLVCSGAGGHGGTINPFAFIHTVKEFFSGKIILSGGISTGSDVAAAQLMGADYVYMGTRFIATEESNAQAEYKQMIIDSALEDIIYTNSFSGIHANYLIPSLHRQGIDPKTLKPKEEIDLSHVTDVKAWRDIWSAGQGVTAVKQRQTVKEIIQQLEKEYQKGMNRLL